MSYYEKVRPADRLAKVAYKAMTDHYKSKHPEEKRARFRWESVPEEDREMWRQIAAAVLGASGDT